MRYQTSTSQFGLLNGSPYTRAEPLLALEARAPYSAEARKGQLYIVAEADDQARAGDACQLMLKTIQRGFYEDSSLSVTSALRKAIVRANRTLYERNFSTTAAQRAYVGISCAVLRGTDLYIAQIAPAQAYLLARGSLRALPPHLSWNPAHLSATPFVKPTAMGASLFIEPEFFRSTLGLEDGFLICSSNLARLLSREMVGGLLAAPSASDAIEQLIALCQSNGIPTAHGLVVQMRQPGAEASQATPAGGVAGRVAYAGRSILAWGSSLGGEAAGLMRQRKPQQEERPAPATAGPATEPPLVEPIPKPRPIDLGPSIEERRQASGPLGRDASALPPSTFLGERGYTPQPPTDRTLDLSDTPSMGFRSSIRPRDDIKPLVDMTLGERLALPLQRVAGVAANSFSRRRRQRFATPGLPPPRGRGLSYRRQAPPFPWVVLLVLALLVGSLVYYGYNLSQQNAVEEARSVLDDAEDAMAAVSAAATESEALQRLDAAREAISQLQASEPISETNSQDWFRFQQIQRELARTEASLLRISTLEGVEEVATHPAAGGVFSKVIVPSAEAGNPAAYGYVYAFDNNTGILYRIPYDGGEAQPLLKPNDEVQGLLVGDVILTAWRTDSVVAVDRNVGSNFYFRNGESWNYAVIAGSEEWPRDSQIDMEVYQGNVYFWNAFRGQILRYLAGNYGNPPDSWIVDAAGQQYEDAVDMAIDGNVYLLQSDGRILAFEAGIFAREIVPSGLNPPLSLVSRFSVLGPPESGSFLIVDTLNERIVQIDKQSGALIQQMRVPADGPVRLDQLSDVAIDDRTSRPLLYLINGRQVLRLPLPPPPQPFAAATPEIPAAEQATPQPSPQP
jgi:hypothetical protein